MQSIHRLTRVVAQGIAQRQNAEQRLAAHHQHYRLPGAFQLLDLRLMLCRGGFAGCADQDAAAVDFGFDTRARQRPLAAGKRNAQLTPLRFTDDSLRQRVAGALLHCRRQRQQRVVVNFGRGNNRSHLRLADGQGAGFIERHLAHLAQLLQRRAAFD